MREIFRAVIPRCIGNRIRHRGEVIYLKQQVAFLESEIVRGAGNSRKKYTYIY